MRVAITGGCGYVGSVLVEAFGAEAENIDLLDIRPPAPSVLQRTMQPEGPRVKYLKADVADPQAMRQILSQYDFIIHLAALVGYPACKKDPQLAHRTNVTTTENLLRFKRDLTQVLFTSTVSVYGDQPAGAIVTEQTAARPNSIYGETKRLSEELLLKAGNNIVFRYAGSFGSSPCMRHDVLIHDFVSRAAMGQTVSIYESHFVRQFIHVKDMVSAILHALRNRDRLGGNIFNIGNTGVEITKGELCEAIARHCRFDYKFENSGTDLEKRNYHIKFDKFFNTGFQPRITLDEGIAELVQHYQSHQYKELSHGG